MSQQLGHSASESSSRRADWIERHVLVSGNPFFSFQPWKVEIHEHCCSVCGNCMEVLEGSEALILLTRTTWAVRTTLAQPRLQANVYSIVSILIHPCHPLVYLFTLPSGATRGRSAEAFSDPTRVSTGPNRCSDRHCVSH